MSNMREGPLVTITKTCTGCVHLRSTYYAIQGDSGFDTYCRAARRDIPGVTTPDWCPCLVQSHIDLRAAEEDGA